MCACTQGKFLAPAKSENSTISYSEPIIINEPKKWGNQWGILIVGPFAGALSFSWLPRLLAHVMPHLFWFSPQQDISLVWMCKSRLHVLRLLSLLSRYSFFLTYCLANTPPIYTWAIYYMHMHVIDRRYWYIIIWQRVALWLGILMFDVSGMGSRFNSRSISAKLDRHSISAANCLWLFPPPSLVLPGIFIPL